MSYQQKTLPTDSDVLEFINAVPDGKKRQDSLQLLEMMRGLTGEEPRMWGPTMIGFGEYHYRYDSGHEGDTFRIGFSPRKAAISLYALQHDPALLESLGKHRKGAGCIYITRLSNVDSDVLRQLLQSSLKATQKGETEG